MLPKIILAAAVLALPLVASPVEEPRAPVASNRVITSPASISWGSLARVRSGGLRWSRLDGDGDRRLTRDEWPWSGVAFRNHDWNGDGVLAGAELGVPAGRLGDADFGAGRFRTLDQDHNGVILPEEWTGGPLTFRRIDRNGDGVIMRTELLGAADEPRGTTFRGWDRDGDGYLTLDEWPSDDDAFNRLDADLDGRVDVAEFVGRYRVTERGRLMAP